jgi:hypothetical protein
MRVALLALAAAALTLPAWCQSSAVLQMDYTNPGLSPSHWTLTIHPDGSGHFRSDGGSALAQVQQTIDAPNLDRDIRLSAPFAQRVFRTAQSRNWSGGKCDSHMKVAFQGWKKITYSGPEGGGVCAYNYSTDKQIEELGDSLAAVASTILEGARLEALLAHDPLGLDKEMEYLAGAARDGHLEQICAIREILERVAENPGVMERVRKRAMALLTQTEK